MRKRVAVVTGASRGIGKATLKILREKGFTTIGLSRSGKQNKTYRRLDVQNEFSVREVFSGIKKDFKRIDVLVNCAGVVSFSRGLNVTAGEWAEVLQTNLLGSYWTSREAIKIMLKNRSGRIVNVSSIAGRAYSKTASLAYTCSKYGVIGLTRQMAVEFAEKGIRINCVCPSQTRTEMLIRNVPAAIQRKIAAGIPSKRLAEPREVAEAIAYLADEKSSYINGAVLDINGGQL